MESDQIFDPLEGVAVFDEDNDDMEFCEDPYSTTAIQWDATQDCGFRNCCLVSTDPPYYDNIGYGDLSDYFYVWMRRNLKNIYPDLFQGETVPKQQELIADAHRYGGKKNAGEHFRNGMLETVKQIYKYQHDDLPATFYYAYKQEKKGKSGTSNDGWEDMLSAIIEGGFYITAAWPFKTESKGRLTGAHGKDALSVCIVLVCRKRLEEFPEITHDEFMKELKDTLWSKLDFLATTADLSAVDLAQCAIGQGMSVFSQKSKIIEPDGSAMTLRQALEIIYHERDLYIEAREAAEAAETETETEIEAEAVEDERDSGKKPEQLQISI